GCRVRTIAACPGAIAGRFRAADVAELPQTPREKRGSLRGRARGGRRWALSRGLGAYTRDDAFELGQARAAIGAGAQRRADALDAGRRARVERVADGGQPDAEAGA